jgi:hypothetical protein
MPTTLTLAPTGQVLHIPTQWGDVSLEQFVCLYAPRPESTSRPAEILCGLEAGALDALAADDVKYLANLLAFAVDPADVMGLLPTPGLPDIGTLPYGTLVEAQQHLEADPERPWLAYGPYVLALYRVQLTYGRYDAAKVAACVAALLASPVTESYADAAFFLNSWQRWRSDTLPTRPTPTTPKTLNSMPVAKNSVRGLARFSAWIQRRAARS